MSPILFNAVIDYVTSDLPSTISIHNNSIVKYMAFADDLVLFAKCNINSMYIEPYVSVDLLGVDSVTQVVS